MNAEEKTFDVIVNWRNTPLDIFRCLRHDTREEHNEERYST